MTADAEVVESAANRGRFKADCAQCFALCCVALGFEASTHFAIDKQAGQPCPNLQDDFRCGIHPVLTERGFDGCVMFDCFGAGQQVAQVTFGGRSWREAPETTAQMVAVFPKMRVLHELLWCVGEALELRPDSELEAELRRRQEQIDRLTRESAEALLAHDVDNEGRKTWALLEMASELARARVRETRIDRHGAVLIGKNFRGADLRAACLRRAVLIGADLRGADLRMADLLGADLRGADLRGADLTGALFLSHVQVDGAKGDASTGLSPHLKRPTHWEQSSTGQRARGCR